MYLLGITSSILTIPPYKTAHMYSNAPWELLIDVYVLSAVVLLIPRRIKRFPLRSLVKVLLYGFMYPLYIIDTFCFVKFGSTLNPSMLLLMGETTSNEASEFLTSYVTTDVIFSEVGIIMLVPLLHLVCYLLCKRLHISLQLKPGKWVSLACNVIVAGLLVWLAVVSIDNKQLYVKTMTRDTIGDVEHTLAVSPRTEMYQPPMRLFFSIRSNQLIGRQLDILLDEIPCGSDSGSFQIILSGQEDEETGLPDAYGGCGDTVEPYKFRVQTSHDHLLRRRFQGLV